MRCDARSAAASVSQGPWGKRKQTGLRVEQQWREDQAHTSQDTGGRILFLWRRRDGSTGITVQVKGLCIVEYIDASEGAYSQRRNTVAHPWHYFDPGMRQILIAVGRSNSTTRPFEADRPWSASRITSTGFLITCYNVNTSALKMYNTCTRPTASSESALVQSADDDP